MRKWTNKPLGDVILLQRGFDITKNEQIEGPFPVISSSGPQSYHNNYKVLGPGVIIGRKGSLGTVFYSEGNYWPHDTTLWVKDFMGNNPKFIYYFLKCLKLEKLDVGSSNPTLNRNYVHLIDVQIPDFGIQNKIANILSSLDAKIDLNNRINAELEAMAKLIYDYWFVQFDFPNEEGKPYKASGGKMVYHEGLKREIPEGWEVGCLGDLGQITGGSTPSRSNENYFTNSDIPWITPKDLALNKNKKFISRGEIDITEDGQKNANLKILPEGTVLFSSRAPIGYLAIARNGVTTNQGFKSFIPKSYFTSEIIFYTLTSLSKLIESRASGSTFKEISGSVLGSIKIVLPPNNMVKEFSKIMNPIKGKQNLLELENEKLNELRDWLLPMLMNGQVKVE